MSRCFQFEGREVVLTERQYDQALADGLRCKCGECLACRAVEHASEVTRVTPEWLEFITTFDNEHDRAEMLLERIGPDALAERVRYFRFISESHLL